MNRTLVGIVGSDLDEVQLPAGSRIVFRATEFPIVFADIDLGSIEDLEHQPSVVHLKPVGMEELQLTRGIDGVLVNSRRLSRTALNGFAERMRTPIPGDNPPYPVVQGPPYELAWDSEVRLITAQCNVIVINLSKGDPDPDARWGSNDPLVVATRAASERMLVVVAAGNFGEAADSDTLSALSRLPHVLAVGATEDEEGTRLAEYSSVGPEEGDGPFVVSYGASRLDPSLQGTSFAAPRVSSELLVLGAWLQTIAHASSVLAGGHSQGIPLVGLGMVDAGPPNWQEAHAALPAFPVGGVDRNALSDILRYLEEASVEPMLEFDLVRLSVALAKSARPMRYERHEVGHGFVAPDTTRAYIEGFNGADFVDLFTTIPYESVPQEVSSLRLADVKLLDFMINVWRGAALHIYVEQTEHTITLN